MDAASLLKLFVSPCKVNNILCVGVLVEMRCPNKQVPDKQETLKKKKYHISISHWFVFKGFLPSASD